MNMLEYQGSSSGSSDVHGTSLMERLRHENVDQFLTLVRMHLSFVVDINTEDSVDSSSDKPKQFRFGFNKKSKNTPTSTPGAAPFKCTSDNTITDDSICKVYEIIDFLIIEENVKQEGIFRRTGSLSRQQELKQLMVSGSALGLDAGRYSVHDCASVLKGFLAELPQPLLMDQYYQTYCTLAVQYPATASWCRNRLLTALQLLLLLLPPLHQSLLRRLLGLLQLTAQHETSNRMSPDTLATMFTPHLLCPRSLSPEALHTDAVSLAPVVSFMIRHASQLFSPPAPLATDAAAYFTMRARRRALSPDGDLDESISDRTAANTVYTFVDRQRTSVENSSDPTATALAQLYAHIQALPDSQYKRRRIKQFNRQNGYGTPIQMQRSGKAAGSKSLGESIKKHIFNKGLLNRTPKKSSTSVMRTSVSEKQSPFNKDKVTFSNEEGRDIEDVSHKNVILKNAHALHNTECDNDPDYESDASDDSTQSEGSLLDRSDKLTPKFKSEPNLSTIEGKIDDETPKNKCKRTRLFRSKAIAAGVNKKYSTKKNVKSTPTSCVSCLDERDSSSDSDANTNAILRQSAAVSETKLRVDSNRLVPYRVASPTDSSDGSDVTPQIDYLTSTPGVAVNRIEEMLTPCLHNFRRSSMSPITKSTQKLPKAMQESIMTPRSRKPLIITTEQRDNSIIDTTKRDTSESPDTIYGSISPKNDSDFVSSDESNRNSSHSSSERLKTSEVIPHDMTVTSQNKMECKSNSLTAPFREYLQSRSVLTAAPVDLSLNKSEDVTKDDISDSLMFCLDGNVPSDLNNSDMIDTAVSDDKKDVQKIRSPLKNINNGVVPVNLENSPRKRCAESDKNSSMDISYKKSLNAKDMDKENATEKDVNDISLWETDL